MNCHVLEIIVRCLMHNDGASIRRASHFGDLNLLPPRQERTRHTAFTVQHILDRPFDNNFAAEDSRPRPEIDDMICGTHRFFVMLDDDHRVALIAQSLQTFQQHGVVSRMQTD